MSYKFKTQNDFEGLPPKLRLYFPTFLNKRILDVNTLKKEIKSRDFSGVKLFLHKQLGIAASYHFYQYEELVEVLKINFDKSEYTKLETLLEDLSSLLANVKSSF